MAGELLTRLADAQRDGRVPQVVLTGGTIAARVHQELARLSAGSDVDWTRVVLWWGDERFVAAGSEDRNAVGAVADLLGPVAATHVHQVPSTDDVADVEAAAAAYADTLAAHGRGPVRRGDAGHRPRRPRRLAVPGPPCAGR